MLIGIVIYLVIAAVVFMLQQAKYDLLVSVFLDSLEVLMEEQTSIATDNIKEYQHLRYSFDFLNRKGFYTRIVRGIISLAYLAPLIWPLLLLDWVRFKLKKTSQVKNGKTEMAMLFYLPNTREHTYDIHRDVCDLLAKKGKIPRDFIIPAEVFRSKWDDMCSRLQSGEISLPKGVTVESLQSSPRFQVLMEVTPDEGEIRGTGV
jgi:hypothetical protein